MDETAILRKSEQQPFFWLPQCSSHSWGKGAQPPLGTQFAAQRQGTQPGEHVSVSEGMCQVSDTNTVMPSCTALKGISPGNGWWFAALHLQPLLHRCPRLTLTAHCSTCSRHKDLLHFYPGHNLHNHSFPLQIQGCRLRHSSPTLYLTYFLMYK